MTTPTDAPAGAPEIPDESLDTRGAQRRRALACMAWAGAGVLWTLEAGIPRAMALGNDTRATTGGTFSFVQISDSHIGFNKAPNPAPAATLQAAIDKIKAAAQRPALLIHTGDVSHLSRPDEFDTADQIVRGVGLDTYYVPGEHDVLSDDGRAFFARFSRGGNNGWYSFDQHGVHFVALVNVLHLTGGGMGFLGDEQLTWLARDLAGRGSSTPLVVFTHMPLWPIYPAWGWGTDDGARALALLKRFGSVTVLNGHIHQVIQKVEGHVSLQTALSTAYPQPAPGDGPGPGPLKSAADHLRDTLGVRAVRFDGTHAAPGIADMALSA